MAAINYRNVKLKLSNDGENHAATVIESIKTKLGEELSKLKDNFTSLKINLNGFRVSHDNYNDRGSRTEQFATKMKLRENLEMSSSDEIVEYLKKIDTECGKVHSTRSLLEQF